MKMEIEHWIYFILAIALGVTIGNLVALHIAGGRCRDNPPPNP
jgi:uncharacterized protein YneF (UPF0154 family)